MRIHRDPIDALCRLQDRADPSQIVTDGGRATAGSNAPLKPGSSSNASQGLASTSFPIIPAAFKPRLYAPVGLQKRGFKVGGTVGERAGFLVHSILTSVLRAIPRMSATRNRKSIVQVIAWS